MESLLILVAIIVVDAIIKSAVKKKKKQELSKNNSPSYDEQDLDDGDLETHSENKTPKNLQDLIRQFEDAQREGSQGTYTPPTPPISDDINSNNYDELDLRIIAETLIGKDFVDLNFFIEKFGIDENTALDFISELQKYHIIGNVYNSEYEVLVYNLQELDNIFYKTKSDESTSRSAMEAEIIQRKNEAEVQAKKELEKQKELEELEKRAKIVRESINNATIQNNEEQQLNKQIKLSKNINDIRRGFIWAKIIDEPRFKKRWSALTR